ncbi:hypothetical protein [Pontiella desulfatans]|nr:hypothetical protein [Pontiella desulfatans]
MKTLRLNPRGANCTKATVMLGGKPLTAEWVNRENGIAIEFIEPVSMTSGEVLTVELH